MNFNNSHNQKTFTFESNKEYEELSFNEEEWGKPIMEMIQQNYDLHPINFLYDSHTVEYKLSNPIEQLKTDNCNNNTINIWTNFDGNNYFFKFPSLRPLESQNEIWNKIVSNQPKEDYWTCANLEPLNSTEISLKFQSTNDNLKITKEQELNREPISSRNFHFYF